MSGALCCEHMRREFKLKHFGFTDVHYARFSYFQWRVPLGAVLLYRFTLMSYCVFWLVYTSIISSPGAAIPVFAFLTQWTYLVLTIYIILRFLTCINYACNRSVSLWQPLTPENHKKLFHDLLSPNLAEYDLFANAESEDADIVTVLPSTPMVWALKFVWMMYNIASTSCLMVSLVFWTMLYPQFPMSGFELMINIQIHAVTSIIVVMDHFMSAVPYRLLHVIYPVIYCGAYVVFSGIYYAVDHSHVLYPHVIDWSEPGTTALVLCLVAVVVMPLLQLLLFAIYKLRLFLFNRFAHKASIVSLQN